MYSHKMDTSVSVIIKINLLKLLSFMYFENLNFFIFPLEEWNADGQSSLLFSI